MTEPSMQRKIAVVGGIFVSFSALLWLVSLPEKPPEILARLGFISAVVCASALLAFSWAALLAYVARRRHWSPRACYLAGLSIVTVLVVPSYFADGRGRTASIFLLIGTLPTITGYLCRKLAHPELSDEEASAPEPPLSLFPK